MISMEERQKKTLSSISFILIIVLLLLISSTVPVQASSTSKNAITWPWEGDDEKSDIEKAFELIVEELRDIVDMIQDLPEKILETLMGSFEWIIDSIADGFIFLFDSIRYFVEAQRDFILDSLEYTWIAGFAAPILMSLIAAEVLIIIYVLIWIYDRVPFT